MGNVHGRLVRKSVGDRHGVPHAQKRRRERFGSLARSEGGGRGLARIGIPSAESCFGALVLGTTGRTKSSRCVMRVFGQAGRLSCRQNELRYEFGYYQEADGWKPYHWAGALKNFARPTDTSV